MCIIWGMSGSTGKNRRKKWAELLQRFRRGDKRAWEKLTGDEGFKNSMCRQMRRKISAITGVDGQWANQEAEGQWPAILERIWVKTQNKDIESEVGEYINILLFAPTNQVQEFIKQRARKMGRPREKDGEEEDATPSPQEVNLDEVKEEPVADADETAIKEALYEIAEELIAFMSEKQMNRMPEQLRRSLVAAKESMQRRGEIDPRTLRKIVLLGGSEQGGRTKRAMEDLRRRVLSKISAYPPSLREALLKLLEKPSRDGRPGQFTFGRSA